MLTRHVVYFLIVLFFVYSNGRVNGAKWRIMETQLVPEFYECDGLKYNTQSRKPILFFLCSVLNASFEIAFGRDVLSYHHINHTKEGERKGNYDFANIFPTSMITHFGFVAKNVVVKKITAQGWIYNNQSVYPLTDLLVGSDASCEFYISFVDKVVEQKGKHFHIHLISEKLVYVILVMFKENPKTISLTCPYKPQDPSRANVESIVHFIKGELDSYKDLRIHIVDKKVKYFVKKEEKGKCPLESEGPYHIVVPRNLSIKVVKIAQNFLAKNILK
uniref:Uncharacterized protein n=1 Tax=Panagrolaimus sp. JU765 TaxID=591449 RepID=A0AC34QTY2_9BILA